ncbi:MAG: prolyl oligopeptidase family serine peptidase, partial [Ferruginibacter sp.]
GKDEFGGADINDVLNLLPAVAQIPNADTSKIGIHGWSRGGMMTYLVMKKTNRFKAAVVGAGAADLYSAIKLREGFEVAVSAQCIPDYYKNKDAELQKRSAVYWADSLCKTTPLLLMQGSADWRVSPEENLELVSKLYKAKQPLKFILYAGGDHGLREYTTETDAEMKKWFDDYVRDGKALPNMEKHGTFKHKVLFK